MDEVVGRVAAATGLGADVARRAVGIILAFLLRESKSDKVGPMIDALPGAREMAAASGGASSGIMGAFNDLSAAGLGMGQVQGAARAFIAYAREKAGKPAVDEVVASIPGLSQFV